MFVCRESTWLERKREDNSSSLTDSTGTKSGSTLIAIGIGHQYRRCLHTRERPAVCMPVPRPVVPLPSGTSDQVPLWYRSWRIRHFRPGTAMVPGGVLSFQRPFWYLSVREAVVPVELYVSTLQASPRPRVVVPLPGAPVSVMRELRVTVGFGGPLKRESSSPA